VFYCAKNKIHSEETSKEIINIIKPYIILKLENDEENSDYKIKIEQLEKELKLEKERASKIKLFEEQYNSLKKKITNMESKNASLLKELLETKNKIKSLEKTIEEKNNKMGILQAKLDEKIKLIKERELQLNKEIETNMELKFKLEENKNNKELMKINEDLKYENSQLNELIKVMENKMENKTEKKDDKEYENLKNRYEKEFELMASAIYNLGFQFWSLKLEDSEKLKQNENWLVRERIKQYNGDY
jgi:chromosome segregation ATPase